jgi:hypothetical protein
MLRVELATFQSFGPYDRGYGPRLTGLECNLSYGWGDIGKLDGVLIGKLLYVGFLSYLTTWSKRAAIISGGGRFTDALGDAG